MNLHVTAATLMSVGALGQPGPSRVIFPEQRLPLQFSHKQHLRLRIDCSFCHTSATSSRLASDRLTPPEEICASCHEIDHEQPEKQAKPVAACNGCHPGFAGSGRPAPVDVPAPFVKFNHQVHAIRGIACTQCHATAASADLATREELPSMSDCLACHDGRQAASRCTTCHLSDGEGRVRTTLPTGTLVPSGALRGDAHDLKFRMDHRKVAVHDPAYCENCHRPEYCLSCHNGVMKPLDFHGNDYLSLHAADARRNVPDCSSCHRMQTFCLGCHQRSGVTLARDVTALRGAPDAHYNPFFTERRFHPSGWVGLARTPEHHAFEAQRNIAACASCHREETCLGCHSTESVRLGVVGNNNPHPAGFGASRRCETLADKNPRVCLKCHAVTDTRRQCN